MMLSEEGIEMSFASGKAAGRSEFLSSPDKLHFSAFELPGVKNSFQPAIKRTVTAKLLIYKDFCKEIWARSIPHTRQPGCNALIIHPAYSLQKFRVIL